MSSFSILDMTDETDKRSSQSTRSTSSPQTTELNPNAIAFVPRFHAPADGTSEANRIDDILRTVHHLESVNDTETLAQAAQWLGTDPDQWVSNGLDYMYGSDGLGAVENGYLGYQLDCEDALRGSLYTAPQRPQGNTYSRKRMQGKWHRQ